MQTSWSQDQVPHMWDLILAPACLPPAEYVFKTILPYIYIFQNDADSFLIEAILYPTIRWVNRRSKWVSSYYNRSYEVPPNRMAVC